MSHVLNKDCFIICFTSYVLGGIRPFTVWQFGMVSQNLVAMCHLLCSKWNRSRTDFYYPIWKSIPFFIYSVSAWDSKGQSFFLSRFHLPNKVIFLPTPQRFIRQYFWMVVTVVTLLSSTTQSRKTCYTWSSENVSSSKLKRLVRLSLGRS